MLVATYIVKVYTQCLLKSQPIALAIGTMICCTGPEPTVQPVRFWPDHFLVGTRPLLVNAWDLHLQQNINLKGTFLFSVLSVLFY